MLIQVEPASTAVSPLVTVPRFLRPLVEAASVGSSLREPIHQIIREMGFTSFMYGVATGRTLNRDDKFFFWAIAPGDWIAEYDQNGYVEYDPRLHYAFTVLAPPLIWDSKISNGDARVTHFLRRAATHGLGSGLALYLHDFQSKVVVALSQPQTVITARRRLQITRMMGDAFQLASIFHHIFMKEVVEKGIAPIHQGSPLSARENQCLSLAARGMTSDDIGVKLEIAERTVNFHFGNIISKLGVLNRKEAIAMGVAHGLVKVDPKNTPLVPMSASKIREAQLKRWEARRNEAQKKAEARAKSGGGADRVRGAR